MVMLTVRSLQKFQNILNVAGITITDIFDSKHIFLPSLNFWLLLIVLTLI
jgi:hypothetical protein